MASGEVSALYKFSRLCDWLRRIEDLSSQTAPLSGGGGHAARGRQQRVSKQETVRALFREIREVGAKAGAPHADLHDFLRLLIPEEDKARAYKLQDKVFTELYITALQCGESTKQAMREWHARPQHAAAGGTVPLRGDIADVFSRLLQERHAHSAGLSVRELNARLDAFSAARVGAKGAGDTILTPLFRALDYREHKWLIRILLKNLKLGCKTDTILAAYHPSAGELFGQSASLVDVSRKCAAPGFVPTGAELQARRRTRARARGVKPTKRWLQCAASAQPGRGSRAPLCASVSLARSRSRVHAPAPRAVYAGVHARLRHARARLHDRESGAQARLRRLHRGGQARRRAGDGSL